MIGLLRGRLIEKHPNRLLVDVGGVGYDVNVPLSTFYDLAEPGVDVTLRVHTYVREDQIALFGFATPLEQQLFERLIAVSGIGPKIALAALSGIEPEELVRAVRTNDIPRLTSIPGVGKKTAERITLELRDKLPAVGPEPATAVPRASALQDDVLSALVNLGYQRQAAEKAVERVLKAETGEPVFEQVLRRALKGLSR